MKTNLHINETDVLIFLDEKIKSQFKKLGFKWFLKESGADLLELLLFEFVQLLESSSLCL